jgi:hypothetical protein
MRMALGNEQVRIRFLCNPAQNFGWITTPDKYVCLENIDSDSHERKF